MNIILASQSPRRKFLLEKMGLKFDIIPSVFEEYFDNSRPVKEMVEELGLGKAEDVAKANTDAIVIGSDLIVVLDGKQIGKPTDKQEAKAMLRSLRGRSHELVCSVAVVCKKQHYARVESATATITFDEFTDDFIDGYVATDTTYDKAGGYAMQHPMIKPHIISIKGRADTVIGLPTRLISELLSDFDIVVKPLELTEDLLANKRFAE